jgi:hypothetical protein
MSTNYEAYQYAIFSTLLVLLVLLLIVLPVPCTVPLRLSQFFCFLRDRNVLSCLCCLRRDSLVLYCSIPVRSFLIFGFSSVIFTHYRSLFFFWTSMNCMFRPNVAIIRFTSFYDLQVPFHRLLWLFVNLLSVLWWGVVTSWTTPRQSY